MLQGIRAAASTRIGRLLMTLVMGLIIFAFAIWGIGNIFQGFGQGQLASVGGADISAATYRDAYQTALQRIQNQTGQAITNEQARMAGLDSQVLGELLSNAAIDQRAQSLGLAISDDQIAKSIFSDPVFKGANGAFDRDRFNKVLHDAGYSEQSFVREQRLVYLRRQIESAMTAQIAAPRLALDAINRYRAEARTIDYITLPTTAAGDRPKPTDADLKAFFGQRKAEYRAPEYRRLLVLPVNAKTLAKPDAVSDEDARKFYDQVKTTRFQTPERRDVQQIVFGTPADAEAAVQTIKSGTSFEDLAQQRSMKLSDIDLGTKTQGEFADAAIGKAAFALPEGGVSTPVRTAFGFALLHVAKIEAGSLTPFDEMKAVLKTEIADDRARPEVTKMHDKIEDLRGNAGKSLADAAKAVNLEPRLIEAVDAGGRDPTGKPVSDLAGGPALLKAAFASDVGVDNDTIQTRDGGYVWFEVRKVDSARDKTWDEVKGQVETAWRDEEIAKALTAKGADLVKAVKAGQTLASIADKQGVPVKTAAGILRTGGAGLPDGLVAQVFNGAVGDVGAASGADNSRIVFKVTNTVVPPLDPASPQTKQLEEEYSKAIASDINGQYVAQVQTELGVKVNQQALRAAGGSGNNGPLNDATD